MNSEYSWNMNVICVDAEEETLKLYKKVLSNSANQLGPSITTKWSSASQDQNYAVYPAMSGKAAIRTALEAKTNAQDLAVGFFDVGMKGEMDGINTIEEIKRIFPSLLCAIVTDETSMDVSAAVRNSFESQDEWLYIKKPFSEEELMQTACNLVVAWNLRREQLRTMEKIKKQQNNVQRVLFITPSLFHTQTYEELCATTVREACEIAGSNNVFLAMREDGQMSFKEGSGKFKVKTEEEKAQVIKVLTTPSMWDKGCLLTISLVENPLGILFIDDLSSQNQGTEMLELFVTQVASAFENIQRQQEKEKQKAHEQELIIGTKIQRSLLPKERPQSEDIELYGLMQSAKEIGGDYFDYFYREIPPDKITDDIFVSVGDVAGKGVAAGLIMSEVRSFIRALNPFYSSTKEIMDQLSRLLEKDIKGTGRFMSLLLMLWDSKNKYFKFTSAGHEHIIHYIAKEGRCKVSKAGGVVLGLKHSLVSTHLKEQKLSLDKGDVIILFTDGTTESMKNNDSSRMFGLERMVKLTVDYAKLSVDKILNNIYNDIFEFIEDGEQSDDITMVAIKRKQNNKMQFYTIEDFKDKLQDQKVFVRVDTNTTLENGEMPLTSRIEQALETINKLTSYGAAVVVGAHNGRSGETSFVSLGPLFSMLQKQNPSLPKMLCPGNTYDETYEGLNSETKNTIKNLQGGEILILENLRFLKNETAKMSVEEFAQQKFVLDLLESGVSHYVLDGFSVAHRAHMSIVGFSKIPNIAGLAVEKELLGARKIKELLAQNQTGNGRVTFIFGGAKIQDYFQLMESALENKSVSKILPGGLFSSICLIINGYDLGQRSRTPLEKKDSKGKSTFDYQETLQKLMEKHRDVFVMPEDVAYLIDGKRVEYAIDEIPQEAREKGAVLDIGEKTILKYKQVLQESSMAYWKGPIGAFDINPLFAKGSQEVLQLLKENKQIFSVMGGGDTGQMLSKFDTLPSELSYVSLSGGALIQILAGNDLPGISALEKSYTTSQTFFTEKAKAFAMFSETTQLLILFAIFFFIMVPITIAQRGDNIVAKFLLRTVFFPFYLIKWWLRKKEVERRRRNYEILGQYVALLGNNSATLGFFRELIEKGIKEEELEKLIQANLQKMKDFDEGKKKEAIRNKLEEEMQMRELAQEQQTILSEAKMSLEQIKFREQLLDGLYQKIRRKYGL